MGISTHILNTAQGKPASGIRATLFFQDKTGAWGKQSTLSTNVDGRAEFIPRTESPASGNYRLIFETAAVSPFFPEVTLQFVVTDPKQHYHVPLLLSPFGYSTYRGS